MPIVRCEKNNMCEKCLLFRCENETIGVKNE